RSWTCDAAGHSRRQPSQSLRAPAYRDEAKSFVNGTRAFQSHFSISWNSLTAKGTKVREYLPELLTRKRQFCDNSLTTRAGPRSKFLASFLWVFSRAQEFGLENGFNELKAPCDAKVVGDYTGLTAPK